MRSGDVPIKSKPTPALVAVITRKKDWAILREKGWYRIPVKNAPEGLNHIRYIAFYQTKVFAEKWAVNYYARVKDIKTLRRIELLPDEPEHQRAHEWYHRIDIGELQRLPNPIPSRRGRPVVFIPTTLEKLLTAKEINELYHTSPIEEKLYLTLERSGLVPERQFYVKDKNTGYLLDLAIFCKSGNIDVECDGESYHSGRKKAEQDRQRDNHLTTMYWRVLRFSGKEIRQNAGGCLQLVLRLVRKLGGVEPLTDR
ncbi:MAG: endonuclease domain-containing protein [bacterium]